MSNKRGITEYVPPFVSGLCLAAMANAIGLQSLSGDWWLFIFAGSVFFVAARTDP